MTTKRAFVSLIYKERLTNMKKLLMILSLALLTVSAQAGKPWDNGKLKVSDNQRYLQFENGQG